MKPDSPAADLEFLIPDWPAPGTVRSAITTRVGGCSGAPWHGFNLALHVEDVASDVHANRRALRRALELETEPCWLEQVHGNHVVEARPGGGAVADGSYTKVPGLSCSVMVADCLPLLICDRRGTQVAAAHAGWKGLAAGIVESILGSFADVSDLLVWLGPAIGTCHYEVGADVREAFTDDADAFSPSVRPGHWMMDLYALARSRLVRAGVAGIHGGDLCTYCEEERFFSYRRDGTTGRIAALIWLEK